MNRDDKWHTVWCSLRPFEPDVAPGDEIGGVVERITRGGTLVRTDGGLLAFAPRQQQTVERNVGERVTAVVTLVDERVRRISISFAGDGPTYVAGDDASDPSPFGVLRDLVD